MSLQRDLLRQARQLAEREPRRPKQASLRRAISAAYYALFHLFVDEATRLMLGPAQRRKPLRLAIRRAFVHKDMADAARGFASSNVSAKIQPGLNDEGIQAQLRDAASAFVELQQARHEADYDVARSFTRSEAIDLVEQAEQAFVDWSSVRGTIQADAFLMSLLVLNALKGKEK